MTIDTKLKNLPSGNYQFEEVILILLDKILTELKGKKKK